MEEHASGGDRRRPVLAKVLERLTAGDTLVVVRIDRLARSLSHLLEVIDRLEAKGAHFRSLQDPIDTASPQGKFTLQVLGAAAEFERALIRERTKAGLRAARAEGRVGGNPGLRARDPAAIRRARAARVESHFQMLNAGAEHWVPEVLRLRPAMPWEDVLRVVNAGLPSATKPWTQARLIRAAPLEAILAAEEQPGLTERVDQFLAELGLIGQHLGQAVTLMERSGDWQTSIEQKLADQSAEIALLRDLLISMGTDLALPLGRRAAS